MKLNYIGSVNLPNANRVFPCGNGSFGQIQTTLSQEIERLFMGVQFDWGKWNVLPDASYLTAYSNLTLPGLYYGGGKGGPGIYFFGDSDYAWWNAQTNGQIGAGLIGSFGYAYGNCQLRADYRTTGQSPVSHASHTQYLNGLIHSTANGGLAIQAPEYPPPTGGVNPDADCINTTVTFLGFKSPIYAYVAVDMKVTTFPTSNGHDILFNPLYPVGSTSSQTMYGGFGLLNLTNGNYEMFGELLAYDANVQDSHNNGDGTASNGAMLADLTQAFNIPPKKNGQIVTIQMVVDADANFAAQDDRGFVNVTSGVRTANMQWALNHYGSPGALAEYSAGWSHNIFKGGLFPTSGGTWAEWLQSSTGFDYSEYTLQNLNGTPAGNPAPYCVVNGVQDSLVLERFKRPGIPLNYPMPFNNWLGVIYYRGLACFVFQDTIGAGGPVTYDVYIPKNLQYAVAFNGMRNFTRPISPSTGDNLS